MRSSAHRSAVAFLAIVTILVPNCIAQIRTVTENEGVSPEENNVTFRVNGNTTKNGDLNIVCNSLRTDCAYSENGRTRELVTAAEVSVEDSSPLVVNYVTQGRTGYHTPSALQLSSSATTVRPPAGFLPQVSVPATQNGSAAQQTPARLPAQPQLTKSRKRKTGLILIGLGLAAGGAGMWAAGKNSSNPDYNATVCRNTLATSGSNYASVLGSPACRETNISPLKVGGLAAMIAGGVTALIGAFR